VTALFDLGGRVALVTGGNGGIGLGLAQGLAGCGARVVITGRNAGKNAAAVTALGGDASAMVLDVTDRAACDAAVAEVVRLHGGLDILVNNAGINVRQAPEAITDEAWDAVIATNLTAMMRLCRAAHPALKASGRGRVINNGSMMSLFGGPHHLSYGASKGGVVQLTKSLAVAWGADNITANAILPGWIETELTVGAQQQNPALRDSVVARTPAGVWGKPDDFRGIAAFLASDAARFVTGTAIPVDGGYAARG